MATVKKIRWDLLHAEYLGGSMSLHALRLTHKIGSQNWFYKKTQGWPEERTDMRQKALEQSKGGMTKDLRDRYSRFADMSKELLEVSLAQARALYKNTFSKDGRQIDRPVKSGDLYNIVASLTGAIKLFRLMEGKSTESIDERGRDYWLAVVDIANKRVPELPPQYKGLVKL